MSSLNLLKTKLFFVLIILSISSICSCSEDKDLLDKDYIEKSEQISDLTDEIMEGFNQLNTKIENISGSKIKELRKETDLMKDSINFAAELINKEFPTKDEYIQASRIYYKLYSIYERYGIRSNKLKTEIEKMKITAQSISTN